jgi:hypothetical protein
MLPEVLNALKELKAELQNQLAQQPEYRALLILDKATSQLGDVLTPFGDRREDVAAQPPDEPHPPPPVPEIADRLDAGRDAPPEVAFPERDVLLADPASPAAPGALAGVADASPPSLAVEAVAPPYRPPDARRLDTDAALESPTATIAPAVAVDEPWVGIGDSCVTAPPPNDLLSIPPDVRRPANIATAPMAVIANDFTELVAARTAASVISGMAALYRSAGEASGIAIAEESLAEAPMPATAAAPTAAASQTDIPARPVEAFAPNAPSSGLTAALYESAGDAPDLVQPEDRVAEASMATAEDPAHAAMAAFNLTLAEAAKAAAEAAAKAAAPQGRPAAPRNYLPIITAQRLAQGRRY